MRYSRLKKYKGFDCNWQKCGYLSNTAWYSVQFPREKTAGIESVKSFAPVNCFLFINCMHNSKQCDNSGFFSSSQIICLIIHKKTVKRECF